MRKIIRSVALSASAFISFLFYFTTVANAQPYPFEQEYGNVKKFFGKIEGTWKQKDKDEYEQWKFIDEEFKGSAFTIDGKDTIINEKLRMFAQGRHAIYQATVLNQNMGKPVNFNISSCRNNKAVFINSLHDFPTSITYEILDYNNLKATISGTQNGKTISIDFEYSRVE